MRASFVGGIVAFSLAVAVYAAMFWLAGGDEGSYCYRLLNYIAPILSGGLTLIGVALTVLAQRKFNDDVFKHNEDLNLLLQRQEHMPIVQCGLESIPIECSEEANSSEVRLRNERYSYRVWLRVRGENAVQSIALRLCCEEDFRTFEPILEADWLDAGEEISRTVHGGEFDGGSLSDESFFLLTFKDDLGNLYWRACLLEAHDEEGAPYASGSIPFGEAFVSLADCGETYCESGKGSEEKIGRYLRKEMESTKQFVIEEQQYQQRQHAWKSQVADFDAFFETASNAAWEYTKRVPEYFRKQFRSKLNGGGYGGGQIKELRALRGGKYLYFTQGFEIGFFDAASSFDRISIGWAITVEVNTEKKSTRVFRRSIQSVDPEVSAMHLLKMRLGFNYVEPRTLAILPRIRYVLASKL